MSVRSSLITSLVLHIMLFLGLSLGSWFTSKPKRPDLMIQAQLVYKNTPEKKKLLPKKQVPKPAPKPAPKQLSKIEKQPETKKIKIAEKPKEVKTKQEPKLETKDFSKTLSSLSQKFASEITNNNQVESVPEVSDDELDSHDDYFQQIYALIKESFVVPSHINGPQGKNLSAVLRIFLSHDGSLTKLNLEKTSGDEHFDKAVKDGTMRVNNFGRVPILLQDLLIEQGVVVELCPFKCAER